MEYYSSLNETGLSSLIPRHEYEQMLEVERVYPFRSNDYYLSLMNLKDPNDPIRRIILPDPRECAGHGTLDPSREEQYTVQPGIQHKYPQTALLLVSSVCAGICRFCFRKRLFSGGSEPETCDMKKAAEYLWNQPELSDVLLSGGDPLMLSPSRLDEILTTIREIPHIANIRIGSKVLAYDPGRLISNPDIVEVIRKHVHPGKKIYQVAHFDHPVELTGTAREATHLLKEAGAEIINQTPIIRGVNNHPGILSELFNGLTKHGISPYYVFQCRPTSGNRHLTVPLEESLHIFHQAQARCSGLARRARFIMSHKTGKIEILGKTAHHIYMKYHQVATPDDAYKMLVYRTNPEARWLDDYQYHLTDMIPRMTWLF